MKYLAAFAIACLLFVSTTHAGVIWVSATVAATVYQGPTVGGDLTKTTLSTAKYLEEGMRRNGDPDKKNYFVGFRTDSGQVAVVHIPSKSVAYSINSAPTGGGLATNGTNSVGAVGGNSTVSSLNVDATGFVHDKFTRNTDGSLKSASRIFVGATPGLTISGTVRTGAKRFDL